MPILNKNFKDKKDEHPIVTESNDSFNKSVDRRDLNFSDKRESYTGNSDLESLKPFDDAEAQSIKQNNTNTTNNQQPKQFLAIKKIEHILEEDLADLYFSLDEGHRRIFKEEGEKTARQINLVIIRGKSVLFKIIILIKQWLKLIPGINKFFIEQEAKIKAEKIIENLRLPEI